MNILCIHPGASTSTSDVHDGITRALSAQGHNLGRFNVDRRIMQAGGYLDFCYKSAKRAGLDVPRPSPADVHLWTYGDIILRAHMHQYDWVLIFSAMYVPPRIIAAMKRAGLKVAIVFTESPYDDEKQLQVARVVDVCWTNERSSLDFFRLANLHSHYLPHAYDKEIHTHATADPGTVPSHDVVFVGTGFYERIETLANADWTDIDFGLYGIWKHLGSRHKLRAHLKGEEVPNDITSALYRCAKIGLNLFRTSKGFGRYAERVTRAESLNPRSYELAACGLFHISEHRPELTEVFGDLVPTFKTPQELSELIRHYLARPEERDRIARLLPEVVSSHTWDDRARQMVAHLEEYDKLDKIK